jgi:hypothetical protein
MALRQAAKPSRFGTDNEVFQMYDESQFDINRPESSFEDWWMSLDAWIDTPAGLKWLAGMEDAESMRRDAEMSGSRPGFGSTWEGF